MPMANINTQDKNQAAEVLLRVEKLKKHFSQNAGILDQLVGNTQTTYAVDGVNLEIREGETLAVVGESGCGKTTLAQTIVGLHDPTDGTVYYRGDPISELSDRERKPYRRAIQIVFQDPLASLNPRKTVGDILKTPLEVHKIGDDDAERTDIARESLRTVGLEEEHLERFPRQFSGGQQQRIAIARALTLEPDILIADEPVSALDASVQAQILKLLERLQSELGIGILFIAHDLSVVKYISDRVAVMYLGEVVETGPTADLFEDPQHPYTKSLLSAVPRIEGSAHSDRIILEGTPPSPQDPPTGCRFHPRCPAVIPPESWTGTQQQFKTGFGLLNRIKDEGIELETYRARLDAAGKPVTTGNMREEIIERNFEDGLQHFPDTGRESVKRGLSAYIEGDRQEAVEHLESVFFSPCQTSVPQSITTNDNHTTSCHRIDPDAPGAPDLL